MTSPHSDDRDPLYPQPGSTESAFFDIDSPENDTLDHSQDDSSDDDKEQKSQAPLHLAVASSCLLALVLALLLRAFVAQAYEIRGKSMEPTLHDGEKVMISKLSPGFQSVERGDLIIFSSPRDPQKDLIKRVIAIAGDEIEIIQGRVFVNEQELEEGYVNHSLFPRPISPGQIPSPVPDGHVVVLGDNRPNSQDSRHFGAVSLTRVKGEVFLRWWPLSQFSTFP